MQLNNFGFAPPIRTLRNSDEGCDEDGYFEGIGDGQAESI
ncbi:hypothetical protein RLEG12_09330 (plasmid) [Rhizobium leguminosarum bv. trifolii CB782]|nr:hypothetical protein RLEG12_09330 [Rhizobium leguminosarum bv. trifolii CB782]